MNHLYIDVIGEGGTVRRARASVSVAGCSAVEYPYGLLIDGEVIQCSTPNALLAMSLLHPNGVLCLRTSSGSYPELERNWCSIEGIAGLLKTVVPFRL